MGQLEYVAKTPAVEKKEADGFITMGISALIVALLVVIVWMAKEINKDN